MSITERINSLMQERNLKPSEVADSIGISRSNLTRWKNKEYVPSSEHIIALSQYFGITTDWILTGMGEMNRAYQEANQVAAIAENIALRPPPINPAALAAMERTAKENELNAQMQQLINVATDPAVKMAIKEAEMANRILAPTQFLLNQAVTMKQIADAQLPALQATINNNAATQALSGMEIATNAVEAQNLAMRNYYAQQNMLNVEGFNELRKDEKVLVKCYRELIDEAQEDLMDYALYLHKKKSIPDNGQPGDLSHSNGNEDVSSGSEITEGETVNVG